MPGREHGDADLQSELCPSQNPTNMGRRGQACRSPLCGTPGRGQAGRCQAGLAGGREEHRSPSRGGGRAWKRLLLPERRDLLCCARKQGSLRAAFVQGEKMMAAGSAASQLPAQAEPVAVFLPSQSAHLGWGVQGGPRGPNSQSPFLTGSPFPQPYQVYPKNGVHHGWGKSPTSEGAHPTVSLQPQCPSCSLPRSRWTNPQLPQTTA